LCITKRELCFVHRGDDGNKGSAELGTESDEGFEKGSELANESGEVNDGTMRTRVYVWFIAVMSVFGLFREICADECGKGKVGGM
jgi:hypothetical protein